MINQLIHISKEKFAKYRKKELISVSFFSALSNFIRIIGNFIISKYIAVTIGPAGITLIGQLTNFNAIAIPLSSGAINSGVTKYLSEFSGNLEKLKTIISTAVKITFFSSITIAIFIFFLSDYLSNMLFKTEVYSSVLKVFSFTITFFAFNNLLLGILRGLNEFKTIVRVNIISSFFSVAYTLFLIYNFSLTGALYAYVTSQSIIILVTIFFFLKKRRIDSSFIKKPFDLPLARHLGGFTLMIATTALTVPVSQLLIRNMIIKEFGLDEAGLWEALNRTSLLYVTFITTSIGFYYMPKLSSISKVKEIKEEVANTAKLALPLSAFIIITVFTFKGFFIELLFSSEFKRMEDLFLFQVIGDFFRVCSWLFSTFLIAKALRKEFIIKEISISFILVILSFLFVIPFGIRGATMAYAIAYGINAILLFRSYKIYLRRIDG